MLPSMACLPTGGVADQPKRSSYRPSDHILREMRELNQEALERERATQKRKEEEWALKSAVKILTGNPGYELMRSRLADELEKMMRKQPKAKHKRLMSLLMKNIEALEEFWERNAPRARSVPRASAPRPPPPPE